MQETDFKQDEISIPELRLRECRKEMSDKFLIDPVLCCVCLSVSLYNQLKFVIMCHKNLVSSSIVLFFQIYFCRVSFSLLWKRQIRDNRLFYTFTLCTQ